MTTWHDIADQLTPIQVDHLTWLEGDPMGGILVRSEQHLRLARGWASYNLAQSFHADVPPPADAVDVGPWIKRTDGARCRSFRSVTGIGGLDIAVETNGSQHTDGRTEGRVSVTGALSNLSAADLRDVAAALLAAADRVEER
jgi:hypothetical protein